MRYETNYEVSFEQRSGVRFPFLWHKVFVIDFSVFWTVALLPPDSIIRRPASFRMQHTCREMEMSLCNSCRICFSTRSKLEYILACYTFCTETQTLRETFALIYMVRLCYRFTILFFYISWVRHGSLISSTYQEFQLSSGIAVLVKYFFISDVWLTVHRNSVWIRKPK